MDNINDQIREVELSMEQAKEAISVNKALTRLYDNKDFQEVITKGFFEDEAIRTVSLRADPGLFMEQNSGQLKMVESIITSIGGLRQYFFKIQNLGSQALQALEEYHETHEELLTEQLNVSKV